MYAAKAAYKGVAVAWEHRLDSTDEKAAAWTSDLERAVAEQQFVLVYQPVVESVSQRIVAVEALLRWQHPRYGLLAPDRFIDDLETTGLIVQVGEWVLRTACTQTRTWSDELGVALDIHVNVSGRQLSRTDFPHVVRRALEASLLNGNRLVLELTETSLVESNRAAGVRLRAVKRLGCRVALDDFGTGYSSLAHLKDFPIDMLKVDRSFISELSLDAVKPSLAGVLINLGASIGATVVAEGVETEEQLRALTAMHCPLYQGFYFSRPVDPERLGSMLASEGQTAHSHPRLSARRTGRPEGRPVHSDPSYRDYRDATAASSFQAVSSAEMFSQPSTRRVSVARYTVVRLMPASARRRVTLPSMPGRSSMRSMITSVSRVTL